MRLPYDRSCASPRILNNGKGSIAHSNAYVGNDGFRNSVAFQFKICRETRRIVMAERALLDEIQ